jgi:hypothetical protein
MSNKQQIYCNLDMRRDLKPDEVAPVYIGEDRDHPIGKAEITTSPSGHSECLITLDLSTSGAQEVIHKLGGQDISVSGSFREENDEQSED